MPKNNRTRRPSMNNAISEKPQCAACSISPHTKPIKIHQSTAEFITISKMQQDMTKCLKSNWGWRAMTLVSIYLVHPRTHLACPNSMTTTPSDWDFSGCARLAAHGAYCNQLRPRGHSKLATHRWPFRDRGCSWCQMQYKSSWIKLNIMTS